MRLNSSRQRTIKTVKHLMRTPLSFAEEVVGIPLRSYQAPVASAIVHSVTQGLGHTIVVIFPRQSGKNELQAIIEAYLLSLLHQEPAEIVKISPTARPQSQTAMRRLERVLRRSQVDRGRWHKESGYIYRVGQARIYFLSGASDSNIVGATASTMLEVDEAQHIAIDKYDREIAPMAASTNATRVFWGTAWTSRTLLARELQNAREAEKVDGLIRSFVLSANDVSAVLPAYGKFVQEQVSRLGRNNPMIRTQFFSETIDAECGMFNPARRALMQGTHPPQNSPVIAREAKQSPPIYAITIDIAGEDEAARDLPSPHGRGAGGEVFLSNPGRDSTALTVFEVEPLSPFQGARPEEGGNSRGEGEIPGFNLPTYKVVTRHQWTGIKHSSLFARISAIIDLWSPIWIVVDATGVGQTLSSFMLDKYPTTTLPFVFTSSSKSALGWDFIALVETGRYKEYVSVRAGSSRPNSDIQSTFWMQAECCQYSIVEGPGRVMRWGVPDGTRNPRTGELVHDDLLISAALVTLLDSQAFGLAKSSVIDAPDIFSQKDF